MVQVLLSKEARPTWERLQRERDYLSQYFWEESQRIVEGLRTDPTQPWLSRLRHFVAVPDAFGVLMPTPTGVDTDGVLWWSVHEEIPNAVRVLDITTEYRF